MAQPALPSKEAALFRHLVQNYETKQYKKGIKAAEQILRKHPNHGDTQAMKALILSNQGKTDEAFELCKVALKNAMKSHVAWHVYGLLYRGVRNYEEATKAYKFALRLEPDSQQIQRDLALLQVQTRDFGGFVQSRRQMLQVRPQQRQNWTALAVALHLSGDLKAAEDVLHRYEETLKQTPPKSDMEHQEAVLYKNMIIAEAGETERALEHLDSVRRLAVDKTSVMEYQADYLLRLGKKDEAEKVYRALLHRNPHRQDYYLALEKALGLSRDKSEDLPKLSDLYREFAEKTEKNDAAKRMPLEFLEGDQFKQHADQYLRRMFKKGVPSTFANVKQLYADSSKKQTIAELVEGYLKDEPQSNHDVEANGSTDGSHKTNGDTVTSAWQLSVNYFLAQHYDYYLSRDLSKAEQHIEKAISLNPSETDYTYHMSRARIRKHKGDPEGASKQMDEARRMDLKDRYINTKCAKYQLRNCEHKTATSTMGLFTRKEAVGGPLGDLLDMQCVWFVTEDGEAYFREGKLSLAFKRFKQIYDIFDTWTEDQFDFHLFSLRKGMVRAYVEMIRWEDKLREHPFFARAALSAIKICCMLYDEPALVKSGGQANGVGESTSEKKKAAKKARKEAEKAEAEKKAAAAKKPQPKDEDGERKKEDPDPEGLQLFKTVGEKPLSEATKFLQPLLELSPKNIDGQIAGFEVYIRRKQYLPALRCLLATHKLDPDHPACHEQGGRLKLALDALDEPLPPEVQQVLLASFLSRRPKDKSETQCNEEYFESHKESAAHVQSVVRLGRVLDADMKDKSKSIQRLQDTLQLESMTLKQAEDGLVLLKEIGAGHEAEKAYLDRAKQRWPDAAIFRV